MMTVTNSVNQLQANNLTSLTKKSNENKQQAEGATATDFAQQLAKASATLDPADAIASVGSALTDIKPTATDIDFDFNNAAALSGGLGSNDFLSQALKGGIETKFNELRKDIASSLIAGLAGEDSATARTVNAPENTPLPGEGVTSGTAENASNIAKSDPAISKEGLTTDNSEVNSITEEPQAVHEPALTSSIFPDAILNLFKSTPNNSLLDKEESNNVDEQKATGLDEEQANNLDGQKAVS